MLAFAKHVASINSIIPSSFVVRMVFPENRRLYCEMCDEEFAKFFGSSKQEVMLSRLHLDNVILPVRENKDKTKIFVLLKYSDDTQLDCIRDTTLPYNLKPNVTVQGDIRLIHYKDYPNSGTEGFCLKLTSILQ